MRDFLDGWLEELGARLAHEGLRPSDARWEAFWEVVRAVGALEDALSRLREPVSGLSDPGSAGRPR